MISGSVLDFVVTFCLELLRLSELEHIRDELLIQLYHSKEAYVDQNTVRERGQGVGCLMLVVLFCFSPCVVTASIL